MKTFMDMIFFLYFVSHIFITMLLDSQLLLPSWIYPTAVRLRCVHLCMRVMLKSAGEYGEYCDAVADWYVAHFVVIMNDVMNDNMAAFGQQTNQLSGHGLA